MTKIGPKVPNLPAVQTLTEAKQAQPTVNVQINNINVPSAGEMNQAWQVFSNAQTSFMGTQGMAQNLGASPLRQQIAYALDPNSTVSKFFNVTHLSNQWGIPSNNLHLQNAAPVSMRPNVANPSVASPSKGSSAPLATPKTPAGPLAHPQRAEAQADFERILEKHHSPFDTKADNMVRSLSKQPGKLEALTTQERGRALSIVTSGISSEADQEAAIRILQSAKNPNEFFGMVNMAGGANKLAMALNGRELKEFKFLNEKHMTSGQHVNHPRRAEARGKFEQVLRAGVNTFDTKSDNIARSIARDPGLVAALTPMEKGRLIRAMGTGAVSERDEESIVSMLRNSPNSGDFWSTVQSAGGVGAINGMLDWSEQGTFNFLQEKFSAGYGMQSMSNTQYNPAAHPANNAYSVPPVSGQNYGNMAATPAYNWGTATGMGRPYDMGFGGQNYTQKTGSMIGGFFKGLLKGVGSLLKTAVKVAIPAAIGFFMGGPVGAVMGGLNGLMGGGGMGMLSMLGGGMGGFGGGLASMAAGPGNMWASMGPFSSMGGFGGSGTDPMMNFMFGSLFNSFNPAGAFGSLLGPLF